MKEKCYQIKEAAAKVGVESHVLRYWEEELKMDIRRNEMGHRYYTTKDIEVLSKVRDLKDKGLQLKAIRSYLEMRRKQLANESASAEKTDATVEQKRELVAAAPQALTNAEKLQQFEQVMSRILSNAVQENSELIGKTAGEHAATAVAGQLQGMTKEQEERAEERYRKLDQTLRELQRARAEAAAANMRPVDKRRQRRLNRKNHQTQASEQASEGQADENQK